jgi:hypothetical protein
MKHIIIYLSAFCLLLMSSCAEDTPYDIHENPDNFAPFISIEQGNTLIDFNDASSAYTFVLTDPANAVATYDLDVVASTIGDTVDVLEVTDFPQEVSLTLDDIATAYGLSRDDIPPGTILNFYATVEGINGKVTTAENLNGDVFTPGIGQGYTHSAAVFCPYDDANIAGTYEVTELTFAGFLGETNFTREIVAGPGENQLTIVGGPYPSLGGEDLVIDVDPTTGTATIAAPSKAFDPIPEEELGETDIAVVQGGVFSCVGKLILQIDFGAPLDGNLHAFVLEKQ